MYSDDIAAEADMSVANVKEQRSGRSLNVVRAAKSVLYDTSFNY